jgi:putative ABC transport system permease protein
VAQEIRIRQVPFEVVGVLARKGVVAGSDEDNQILVPIRTALRRVFNVAWLTSIFVSVDDSQQLATAERQIANMLRARHRLASDAQPDFDVQNAATFLTLQRQTAEMLQRLSTGIAAIALIVGGSGILALMLLSVRERAGEIGLRMAVGALRRDILVQFLFEATLLALGGWTGGVLLAGGGAATIALATTWKVAAPRQAVVISFGMAMIIGLGCGAIPARRASLIPPIEALRKE